MLSNGEMLDELVVDEKTSVGWLRQVVERRLIASTNWSDGRRTGFQILLNGRILENIHTKLYDLVECHSEMKPFCTIIRTLEPMEVQEEEDGGLESSPVAP